MSQLVLFEEKQVRRVWHEEAWWFVVVDVVAALTDSANPSGYLKDMRRREPALSEAFKGGGQLATPLLLTVETAGESQNVARSPATPVANSKPKAVAAFRPKKISRN